MKHLQYFENDTPKYNIGDYVIAKSFIASVSNFISNNIGEIVDIKANGILLTIKYYNVPDIISNIFNQYNESGIKNTLTFNYRRIIRYATTDEINELKIKIESDKYNL